MLKFTRKIQEMERSDLKLIKKRGGGSISLGNSRSRKCSKSFLTGNKLHVFLPVSTAAAVAVA